MPTYSNSAQANTNTIFKGSCKIEYSEDSGVTWLNYGIARSVVFQENIEATEIQFDNSPDAANYVSKQTVTITFNGVELYLPNLYKTRGGIDLLTATTVGATTRTDSWASSQWAYNDVLFLTQQGDSTTLPVITAAKTWKTGSTVALTTLGLDYARIRYGNKIGISVLSTNYGGNALDTESLRVTYTYGAIGARKLTSGGLTAIAPKWYKLTNLEYIGGIAKYRYFVVYNGSINAGLNLAFKSSNEPDPYLEHPVSIIAKLDTTRSAGDQLFYIIDEAATA